MANLVDDADDHEYDEDDIQYVPYLLHYILLGSLWPFGPLNPSTCQAWGWPMAFSQNTRQALQQCK